MRRPIKAHLVNRSNWSVYRSKPVTHAILNLDLNSNRPVYRYEPVELSFLNSNLNLTGFYRFPAKPVRYTGTGPRRFDRTGRLIKPWLAVVNNDVFVCCINRYARM